MPVGLNYADFCQKSPQITLGKSVKLWVIHENNNIQNLTDFPEPSMKISYQKSAYLVPRV